MYKFKSTARTTCVCPYTPLSVYVFCTAPLSVYFVYLILCIKAGHGVKLESGSSETWYRADPESSPFGATASTRPLQPIRMLVLESGVSSENSEKVVPDCNVKRKACLICVGRPHHTCLQSPATHSTDVCVCMGEGGRRRGDGALTSPPHNNKTLFWFFQGCESSSSKISSNQSESLCRSRLRKKHNDWLIKGLCLALSYSL